MTELTIKTSNHRYVPVSWHDLPAKAKADFDYLDNDDKHDERFVRYRKWWYDMNEFMVSTSQFPGWQGYHSDSYFSGIVCKYNMNDDTYKMGRYYS